VARAAAIDAAVAAGDDPGPLAGVPIGLKDLIDQTGVVTTAGSSFLDHPATTDATIVTRLEAAGAVIIGRTGLHEFAYGFSSENDWWGAVRNPWDTDTSPGGSSGGSAAAVAAGVVPIGIGTDTGGSVRVPAALCGLVGLKVTHGRIPLSGVFPLAGSLDTVGPLTTSVQDAVAAYSVLAGHDPSDPWSIDQGVEAVTEVELDSLSIGIPHPWTDRAIAPELHRGFKKISDALREQGAQVEDFDEPLIDQNDVPPGSYAEVADVHRKWFLDDQSRYGPTIRDRLAGVLDLDDPDIAAAAGWRASLVAAFDRAFSRFDLLLTPTAAARSKTIGIDRIDLGAGPEPYRPLLSWFTPLVNQARLPALAVPVETSDVTGLPPSIQLIGPRWSEAKLLGVGLALEARGLVAHRTPPTFAR
jgi:aspartyl-tRNA(Asn)/glutamyl-tRNA(Gln) amidotransferase subunit A